MGSKGIGAFIIGGLLGAGAALLYAPRAGAETRALVSDKVSTAWGEAQEFGTQAGAKGQQVYQEATARGQEIYHEVAAKGQEIYSGASARAQEAAENIKPVFAEKNDELRDKIEAARQRIASQVAQNAEAAHATAHEKIPVAAEAAGKAVGKAYDVAVAAADKIAGEKDAAGEVLEGVVEAVAPAATEVPAVVVTPAEKTAE